jgi:hypothetical protein
MSTGAVGTASLNKVSRYSSKLIKTGLTILDVADDRLQGVCMLFEDVIDNVTQLINECIPALVVWYTFRVMSTASLLTTDIILERFRRRGCGR